ncbi:hypothetical protein, partial [Escherichia coli]
SHRTSIKDGLGRHIGSCGPLNRNFLSEEEVSYYKKSLISQEGSIKKGAPGDAPVVAKSALWGVITPCLLHC